MVSSPHSLSDLVTLWIDAAMLELGSDLALHFLEFADMGVEVATLALKIGDVQAAPTQQLAQLLHAGAIDLVKIEQLLDLRQRETEPLAAQDPDQPRAVVRAVEPRQALAARLDQALVLVEADGARRDSELARQFGDAIDALRVARCCGLGRSGDGHIDFIVNVYVNVNPGLRKRKRTVMAIYQLGDKKPVIPASCYVAEEATLIGDVILGERVSILFGAVLRGDNEPITIGDDSNVQDNCVLHTDPGAPLKIG